jgi:hypothetical protein
MSSSPEDEERRYLGSIARMNAVEAFSKQRVPAALRFFQSFAGMFVVSVVCERALIQVKEIRPVRIIQRRVKDNKASARHPAPHSPKPALVAAI